MDAPFPFLDSSFGPLPILRRKNPEFFENRGEPPRIADPGIRSGRMEDRNDNLISMLISGTLAIIGMILAS